MDSKEVQDSAAKDPGNDPDSSEFGRNPESSQPSVSGECGSNKPRLETIGDRSSTSDIDQSESSTPPTLESMSSDSPLGPSQTSSSVPGYPKSVDQSDDSQTNLPPKDLNISDNLIKKLAGLEILCAAKSSTGVETVPSVIRQSHKLKWIIWNGKRTAIVTQNENGPCPLIAIANILLLRGKITLPENVAEVSASDLLDYIGDAIVENMPKDLGTASVLNYEQNMHDAIAVLPHLPTGLDVNVKFTGVRHFEYTPECIIFDLLNIPLYHGWLVDPQSKETVAALGNCGYNQLVERIISYKSSSNADLVTEALIAEDFLERTASQLTYHGLCELNSSMKQEELAVLFRNNHFSTIYKRKNELFLLVTDQGFLHEPRVVWETLCNIDGDGQFVDSHFATVPPIPSDSYTSDKPITEDQQISHDYLVALSLQEDQKKQLQQDKDQAWEEFKQAVPVSDVMSDEELARRLQEDEEQQSRSPPQEGQTERPSSPLKPHPSVERSKKGMCIVL